MKYHRSTTSAAVRAWPPEVVVGHVASEISRVISLSGSGGESNATNALARARELMGVLETSPALPEAWYPCLAEVIAAMRVGDVSSASIGRWRELYDRMMELQPDHAVSA